MWGLAWVTIPATRVYPAVVTDNATESCDHSLARSIPPPKAKVAPESTSNKIKDKLAHETTGPYKSDARLCHQVAPLRSRLFPCFYSDRSGRHYCEPPVLHSRQVAERVASPVAASIEVSVAVPQVALSIVHQETRYSDDILLRKARFVRHRMDKTCLTQPQKAAVQLLAALSQGRQVLAEMAALQQQFVLWL